MQRVNRTSLYPVSLLMLVIGVLTIPFSVWGCSTIGMQSTETRPVDLSKFHALSAKEYYPEALAIAHEWQPDAYLQSANLTVRQEGGVPRNLRASYTFYSTDLHNEALLVWFYEDLSVKSEVVQSGSVNRQEIEEEDWVIDGMDAFKIAQEQGGNDYMSKYSGIEIKLFLEHQRGASDSDLVVWRVSYLRPEGVLYIVVDAVSGDVVEIIE